VEHEIELCEFLFGTTSELDLNLTNAQIEQFMLYLSQLLQWNKTTNLTSITDPYEVISKHFVDSLIALVAIDFPLHGTVIDVGAGAGFPGIPLKIVRNDLQLVLVEPVQKKNSFLHSIVGSLKLQNVSIFSGSLKQYVAQKQYLLGDLMVVRALRFDEIEEQALVALKPTGKVVLYRTEKMGINPSPSPFKTDLERSFSLPKSHGSRVISIMSRTNSV
jgi:16S rRNA (guanine527-N7)-methyltransferase